jgi:hypothetical protein
MANQLSSPSADYGTAGHTLAEQCLNLCRDAIAYLGTTIRVGNADILVDQAMVTAVQIYLDYVRSQRGHLLIEVRLPIGHITGEHGAYGTSDAVLLSEEEVVVIDLKLGANPRNKVNAERNPQLGIYALAAFDEYRLVYDYQRVRMVVVQPRLDHISESTMNLAELEAFRASIRPATSVKAGPQQCKWCFHRKSCPEHLAYQNHQLIDDFADLDKGG